MNTELLQTCYDLQDFLFSMQHISTLFTYYYYSLKKHTCFFHNLVTLPYNSHKPSALTEPFCKGFHSSTVVWKPSCLFWAHTRCIWYPSVLETRGWEEGMKEMQSSYAQSLDVWGTTCSPNMAHLSGRHWPKSRLVLYLLEHWSTIYVWLVFFF